MKHKDFFIKAADDVCQNVNIVTGKRKRTKTSITSKQVKHKSSH